MSDVITLRGPGTGTVEDRRSEFIGFARPVADEDAAQEFVKSVRKAHPAARHTVYAYVLGGGSLKRYSDDGEPQGSAGRPVLDVIEKNGLDGAAVAVVRYFGGILLGTGGLVRAYSGAAAAAIRDAGTVRLTECRLVEIRLSYNDYAKLGVERGIPGAVCSGTDFGEEVTLRLSVRLCDLGRTLKRVTEATSGRAAVAELGTVLIPDPGEGGDDRRS
jgi:uncharacterized YigZ family protein